MTTARQSRVRLALVALLIAVLGLGLLAMTLLDARDLLQGWGTEHVHLSAGMFAYPWFAAASLSFSALIVHEGIMGRTGSVRLATWTLLLGLVAIASLPAAYVAGAMVAGRLEAEGYRRCDDRLHPARFLRDEWVQRGTACQQDGPPG